MPRRSPLASQVRPENDSVPSYLNYLELTDSIDLEQYKVIGEYYRWCVERSQMQDVAQRMLNALAESTQQFENTLVNGEPGTGKTKFIKEVAGASKAKFTELNCSNLSRDAAVHALRAAAEHVDPHLVLLDEVDAPAAEPWFCDALLPFLELNSSGKRQMVFAIAGSSPNLRAVLGRRNKGRDFLTRVPISLAVPPLSRGDRLIVFLACLRGEASGRGKQVTGVEKSALFMVGKNREFSTSRSLHELAKRAVRQMPRTDTRIKYGDLFERYDTWQLFSGDGMKRLHDRYLFVPDGRPKKPDPRRT